MGTRPGPNNPAWLADHTPQPASVHRAPSPGPGRARREHRRNHAPGNHAPRRGSWGDEFQYAPPHATQTDQTNHAPRGGACGDEFQYAPPRATQTDQTPQPWGHLDNKIFYPYP